MRKIQKTLTSHFVKGLTDYTKVMKIEKGIAVDASSHQLELYQRLKQDHKYILAQSGQMWNWPSVATLTEPTLSRILHLSMLYQKILTIPGNVLEFGVHFGASTNLLMNFRRIFEPRNVNRQFHLFDTFEGFSGTEEKDGPLVSEGDFELSKDYSIFLDKLISTQQEIAFARPNPFKLWCGDAESKVDQYLKEFPHHVIAIAFFDMDIYKPTLSVLKKIIPRLSQGSILVFDQFNCDTYPGETLALLETFELAKISLERGQFSSHSAWMTIG
jgi:hypothetical protein